METTLVPLLLELLLEWLDVPGTGKHIRTEGKPALKIVLPLAEKRNNILRDGGMVFRRENIPHETFGWSLRK